MGAFENAKTTVTNLDEEIRMRGAGLLVAAGCALVFLLLSGQVGPAEATRDTWDDSFRDNLYFIDRFAFKEDGTWNVQIDPIQKVLPSPESL
jgi:hypothetical protein